MIRLKTAGLSLSRNHRKLISNLNITFSSGEVWGVLGRNGSGKSTLLQTLAGLLPMDKGNILLNDKSILHLSRKNVAQQIAIVFQELEDTLQGTAHEFVISGRHPFLSSWQIESSFDFQIVNQALESVGLLSQQHNFIDQLSGGEKKRLMIARALTQTPKIYLFDEPTNHLDLMHQQQVLTLFQKLAKDEKKLIIMSLHDVNIAARYCDRILLLTGEEHSYAGTTKEILRKEFLESVYNVRFIKNQIQNNCYWHIE